MVDKNQIDQWLKDGTITKKQADKMLTDTSKYKKDQTSNKLIVTLSTIGALLLGIGAMLFIASNWQAIPNLVKVIILVGSTFLAYYLGYLFKYDKKNLPTVGASLIFLGALLFGVTIFLIAQIYNINANNHVLMVVWIVGILPLVYSFLSVPIAGLATVLLYIWIGLFVFRNFTFGNVFGDFFSLPVLYLVSGVLLFGLGGLHYLKEKFSNIARIYRIFGLKVVMISLFLLTFRFFSGSYGDFNVREGVEASSQFTGGLIMFSILALLSLAANLYLNPSKSDKNKLENLVGIGLLAFVLVFFFTPIIVGNLYVIAFNLILAGLIFLLIYTGYNKEDMVLVNTGLTWLAWLVVVRYFDFFWSLLPRSLFFIIGGLLLVLGGIVLERKRRELKIQFSKK